MAIFDHPDFDRHESVHLFEDQDAGLKAIIAIHSTRLGPSAGGTRLWTYANAEDALTDALRLSKAMSFKNAMAGLSLGGGKGVIMKPAGDFDREAFFKAYGKMIDQLSGTYKAAEDVGMSPQDMAYIQTQTTHVAGLDTGVAASGDPSPVTADGVFRGLTVAADYLWGTSDLTDIRVAVQGVGHVGYHLCRRLYDAGARLIVADINTAATQRIADEMEAAVVDPAVIHAQDVDIYAPCALGGAIRAETIGDIKAKIVGGAANNQLASPDMGDALMQRGTLYCPDYVINAGGIINIAAELSGTYEPAWVDGKLDGLKRTLRDVFDRASAQSLPTHAVAETMARDRIYGPA